MAKKRVVVTGAAGYVAQRMLPALRERWDLVLLDVRPTTRDGKTVPGLMVADLTKPDRNEYRQHFRGAPEADISLHQRVDLAAAQVPALLAILCQRLERRAGELVAQLVVSEQPSD